MKLNPFPLILTFSFLPLAASAVATPDFYRCEGKVSGEWNFGRAPYGCDANAFGEDRVVQQSFPKQVFQDGSERAAERKRYVQDIFTVVRDAATYYIQKRKPTASAEEKALFVLGIEITAAHESKLTHYRVASDNKLKLMRGDVGHGHGIMQVDDRAHFPAVTNGTAWGLLTNIVYGMDEYFAAWERAPNQSCYQQASDKAAARIRSAWAAYNGGPGSICRWTNPGSKWAQNDKNFLDMYNQRTWKSYVADERKPASIDVACLVEKRAVCPTPGEEPAAPVPLKGQLYKTSEGKYCAFDGARFRCVEEARDALCLAAATPLVKTDAQTFLPAFARFPSVAEDRHTLCRRHDPTLHPVGAFLEMRQNVFVRNSPGGGQLGVASATEVVEVLDFELRNAPALDRYYQVRVGGVTGFVYAGTASSQANWVAPSDRTTPIPSVVARPGERVQVVNPAGINLREQPGGQLLVNVPKGTTLVVESYRVQGSNNFIYYAVTHRGVTGYVYAGQVLPADTTAAWLKRMP